jgi:hypothetical protein
MNLPDLFSICGTSFLGVFLILVVLALIMRIITVVFPEKGAQIDEALVAAISTASGAVYPGTKVVKIEEIEEKK